MTIGSYCGCIVTKDEGETFGGGSVEDAEALAVREGPSAGSSPAYAEEAGEEKMKTSRERVLLKKREPPWMGDGSRWKLLMTTCATRVVALGEACVRGKETSEAPSKSKKKGKAKEKVVEIDSDDEEGKESLRYKHSRELFCDLIANDEIRLLREEASSSLSKVAKLQEDMAAKEGKISKLREGLGCFYEGEARRR
ncbi:hypothetical protein Fot_22121 [Forsythia ovata]|uniref:Uncharacterized protein n=1 Tax=Forsythia ovata TaxID=205694 RepID=A0ABD1UYG4_9LAMI